MAIAEELAGPVAASDTRPSWKVKLLYSLGQMAQSGGFDTAIGFVFFYYTAVLGLSGALVGLALAVSLAFDAVVDPLVGSWSDNVHSRLGRRMPMMIAATPLAAVTVGLLFSPPHGLGGWGLFGWLTVTSVAARSCISLFNVPYVALGAEMAQDYAERTRVVVYRAVAGIFSGVACTALGFTLFFAHGGLQKPEGYPGFGWTVAGLILGCLSLCCLGIWRYAARLPQPAPLPGSLWRRMPGEVAEVFANRSFRILFFSAVLTYVALGLNATLNNHAFVFVWRLRSESLQFLGYAYLFGILLGVPIAPLMQTVMEKKTVVTAGLALLIGNWLLLQGLRVAGIYAPVGDAALLPQALNSFIAGIGIGLAIIAYPSMMADAADEHELLHGRRREGLYFAGLSFAGKAATGLGVLVAGLALDAIRFPKDVAGKVGIVLPEDVQVRLVLIWGPGAAVICVVALWVFRTYAISRRRHDEIAEALRGARG